MLVAVHVGAEPDEQHVLVHVHAVDHQRRQRNLAEIAFLKPLCVGEAPVGGAWTCPTDWDEAGTAGCETRTACTRPLTLNDGTALTEATDFDSQCSESTDGTSAQCKCAGTSIPNELTLLSDMSASDIATCHLTACACADAQPLVLEGSPSCTPSNAQADRRLLPADTRLRPRGNHREQPSHRPHHHHRHLREPTRRQLAVPLHPARHGLDQRE